MFLFVLPYMGNSAPGRFRNKLAENTTKTHTRKERLLGALFSHRKKSATHLQKDRLFLEAVFLQAVRFFYYLF
jgi:hypothetical protein